MSHVVLICFYLTDPFFQSYSELGYSRFGRSPKYSWELLWQNFYRPNAVLVIQLTASKCWRMTVFLTWDSMLQPCCQNRSGTLWWLHSLPCSLTTRELPLSDNNSAPDLGRGDGMLPPFCHGEPGEHSYGSAFFRPDAILNTQPTV